MHFPSAASVFSGCSFGLSVAVSQRLKGPVWMAGTEWLWSLPQYVTLLLSLWVCSGLSQRKFWISEELAETFKICISFLMFIVKSIKVVQTSNSGKTTSPLKQECAFPEECIWICLEVPQRCCLFPVPRLHLFPRCSSPAAVLGWPANENHLQSKFWRPWS